MDLGQFNFRSKRAMHARYGKSLSPWIFMLELLAVLLLVGGIALILGLGMALGWALAGLAAIPVMVVEWYKYELRDVPIVKNGTRIDDVLESEVLAMLPDQPSPKDIARVISRTSGGAFMAVRFGIGGSFLEQLVSADRADTRAVFDEALAIARSVDGRISNGVLILALLRQISTRETLLGHLQLKEEDLIEGIKWQNHLTDLIARHEKLARRPGGVGRDWSFGWIPNLSRFGQNISEGRLVEPSDLRAETLQQIARTFEHGRGSLALVGANGVGKTELLYDLASLLMHPKTNIPESLRYHQVFLLDATRLVSAAGGEAGRLETIVQTVLAEAFTAKNIVVCLDNAHLFFENGVASVDISGVLLPILEAGRLPIVLTMDEQDFLRLSKRIPLLASAINRINVLPTDANQTLKVLQDKVPALEYKYKVNYMYQALREAFVLGSRYVYDISMPGQAITLLEAAAEHHENGIVTALSVHKAIEQITGVKTSMVDDESERDTLLNLESLIHARMIGQDRAVSVVSDALRRARAGVRNQNRPVGTFLFLGPTGVGKTELAKSLADVYFGGEDKIVRIDMNEFVSSADVARLIADGAEDPMSLTAQVMKNPFSVVLLDEIEKADTAVLATLLQLLDEGILRDTKNREVSFRDTIVIATSNANADRIQEYIHRGYSIEQFEHTFIDELIGGQAFRPEFLNRFDEMVVFTPLQKYQLMHVVDLILAGVNKNLSAQNISVVVGDDVKEYLVDAGYDPRLGARPMRRVVQRAVENTVAKLLLSKEVLPGGTIEITLEQVMQVVQKKEKADKIATFSE